MNGNILKSQAFKLKGRLYTLTVLELQHYDETLFTEQLESLLAKAPRFFAKAPIVLDFSALKGDLDLPALCQHLKSYQVLPVAIQGASPQLAAMAEKQGLALLHSSATHDKLFSEADLHNFSPPTDTQKDTKLLTVPIRSGQQVVNREGDIIVSASVSPGAEVLAKGNIHVYGTLRGRALAGLSGNKSARIFCQSLEAELVAIAGVYRLRDAIQSTGPCQIYLSNEQICIEPIC